MKTPLSWACLTRIYTSNRKLEADMIAALKQDAEDHVYQSEIMAWDSVAGDGIDAKK
jgi:hypothetical protein